MLPNTNLQYCIIALYFLLKLFGLQMGDWPIDGGGGWGQNSCLVLVVIYEFDLRYCCSSKTSVNTF